MVAPPPHPVPAMNDGLEELEDPGGPYEQ
jgi:hypothetical protein